jgi:cell division septal protein FtsQ
MTVRAATEKNFRRAKVAPVKRRGILRWITWRLARTAACAALVLYAAYYGCGMVLNAPALQVRRVVIRGNARLSTGEIHALIGGLAGSSILSADLSTFRRRLLQSPWVETVAMRRLLPSTVEIFVSERRPIGVSRLRGHLYLVDRHGTIIDEFGPQYADFDLPIVDGLLRAPGTGRSTIDEARADLAARVLDSLVGRKDLAGRVSQIDVSDVHDAVVLLDDDPALLHLGDERFAERLQYYVDIAPALRRSVQDMDYVDLRFGERVYVRPAAVAGRRNQ